MSVKPGPSMAERRHPMQNNPKTHGTVTPISEGLFIGLLIGAVSAGVAVLLYAPNSGTETRKLLRDEYIETQKMFQRWSDELRERVDRLSRVIRIKSEEGVLVSGNGQKKII
jgi:gas vesicle protein